MLATNPCKHENVKGATVADDILQLKLEKNLTNGITSLIGATAMIDLSHFGKSNNVKILAKAEFQNPAGSVKDRTALNIITNAINRGQLTSDKVLLDSTSGNTGIAYAMICSSLGIELTICIPKNASKERLHLLRAYGANLVFSDPTEGSDGAMVLAKQMVRENPDKYYYADQYSNPCNWMAHYHNTGFEIWEQTDRKVSHFVAGLGTTGTFTGVMRRLKSLNHAVQGIAFQPNAAFHGLEGLKHLESSIIPQIFDESLVDRNLSVSTVEAYKMTRRLAKEEGLLVGISSGASVMTAVKIANALDQGVVVTILPDRGERYLSENLWRDDLGS